MKKYTSAILIALLAIFGAANLSAQALWLDGSEDEYDPLASFEADKHEWAVHDMVMIHIDINSRALRTTSTEAEREFDIDAGLDEYIRLASGMRVVPGDGVDRSIKADSSLEVNAEATGQRRSTFSDVVMAKVVEVMPNYDPETGRGTLRIKATRSVRMGDDDETTTLTGEVAAHMIMADDSIDISRVAELKLVQDSEGTLADGSKPGWLSSFLLSVWPF